MQDLKNLTLVQLHWILIAYEMRKVGSPYIGEVSFKATIKGREKKESGCVSEEEEANFVKKLQVVTGRFRGKLLFKCFSCGSISHCVASCPYKENHEKENEHEKLKRRSFENKRSFYTHEDSDGLSNGEEGESNQECQLLMAFKYRSSNEFDALEEKYIFDNDISDVVIVIYVNKYSSLGAPLFLLIKNEEDGNKELSFMGFCSNCSPFPYLCNNHSDGDNETTQLGLMGESESKHSKERTNSKMMPLEVEDQDKSKTMENSDVSMLSKDNYQQWKENMNSNITILDVWYLVCNGYTRIPPSNEDV